MSANILALVSDYSCSYWKGRVPRQGWMYCSVNHVCFYSFLMGKEAKIILRWTDVVVRKVETFHVHCFNDFIHYFLPQQHLERGNNLLFPDSIKVATRDATHYFSMFINSEETFDLMEQLANLAMKQYKEILIKTWCLKTNLIIHNHSRLIQEKGFEEDLNFPPPKKKTKQRKVSSLKRDLDARARSEAYRSAFKLPVSEKLDGDTDCMLFTTYNKTYVWGRLYISTNYICYTSRVCHPLRMHVNHVFVTTFSNVASVFSGACAVHCHHSNARYSGC